MKKEFTTTEKIMLFNSKKLNSSTVWLLTLIFGWSYGNFGEIGKQMLYYIFVFLVFYFSQPILYFLFIGWYLWILSFLEDKIDKHNNYIMKCLNFSDKEKQMLLKQENSKLIF